MLGIFKSKPLLSVDDAEFQVATYKWLLKNYGGEDFYKNTKLVLPTKEFFPSKVESEEEAAVETFNTVKGFAGMQDWPCRLERQEEDVNPLVSPTIAVRNVPTNPLGTFEAKDQTEVVITYNPVIVANPAQLVATFAHELAHYLTGSCKEEPPGGWENWEFATDIAATFLGFGVFMANSASNFSQFADLDSQGWQHNRSGYLSEEEHIFALAIFIKLQNITYENVFKHLKPSLTKMLRKVIPEIEALNILEELSSVKYVEDHS